MSLSCLSIQSIISVSKTIFPEICRNPHQPVGLYPEIVAFKIRISRGLQAKLFSIVFSVFDYQLLFAALSSSTSECVIKPILSYAFIAGVLSIFTLSPIYFISPHRSLQRLAVTDFANPCPVIFHRVTMFPIAATPYSFEYRCRPAMHMSSLFFLIQKLFSGIQHAVHKKCLRVHPFLEIHLLFQSHLHSGGRYIRDIFIDASTSIFAGQFHLEKNYPACLHCISFQDIA